MGVQFELRVSQEFLRLSHQAIEGISRSPANYYIRNPLSTERFIPWIFS